MHSLSRKPAVALRSLGAASANQLRRRSLSSFHQTNIGYARLVFGDPGVFSTTEVPLRCRIFDTPTGQAFKASLLEGDQRVPFTIPSLSAYGNEVYGAWKCPLATGKQQPTIPPGGLAYSEQGNYLCVFYGQTPAWPVDYFAQIEVGFEALQGGQWRSLQVALEDPLAMESY